MGFIDINEIEKRSLIEGASARFVHSENMTLANWEFAEGVELPEHSHPHEQITRVISGEFEMTIDGEVSVLTKDKIAVIPPNAVHKGKALTECIIIDVFNPVRDDYK